MTNKSKAQTDFESRFITANEIAARVGVSRPAVIFARQRGALPDEILVGHNHICIWHRKQIEPFIVEWEKKLAGTPSAAAVNGEQTATA